MRGRGGGGASATEIGVSLHSASNNRLPLLWSILKFLPSFHFIHSFVLTLFVYSIQFNSLHYSRETPFDCTKREIPSWERSDDKLGIITNLCIGVKRFMRLYFVSLFIFCWLIIHFIYFLFMYHSLDLFSSFVYLFLFSLYLSLCLFNFCLLHVLFLFIYPLFIYYYL